MGIGTAPLPVADRVGCAGVATPDAERPRRLPSADEPNVV
jgi:hypothetical protein